eukprot:gnl/MRDRNA2_/MRDRNA2_88968_c0_seq1.p1 gnl/MRDRNA2_/MRDRNA2_88968_c0~~gnl/MRDRNA2_/MRDRNA2_88968_c0_seq1.p1  ORF type:complete len:677 (+),score=72.81 gnl/MRDRNA2_/MRDRNA2_88968_c0_seq1:83-2113(+)
MPFVAAGHLAPDVESGSEGSMGKSDSHYARILRASLAAMTFVALVACTFQLRSDVSSVLMAAQSLLMPSVFASPASSQPMAAQNHLMPSVFASRASSQPKDDKSKAVVRRLAIPKFRESRDCFSSSAENFLDLIHNSKCIHPQMKTKTWYEDTVEECARKTKEEVRCDPHDQAGKLNYDKYDQYPTGFLYYKQNISPKFHCAPIFTQSPITEVDFPTTLSEYPWYYQLISMKTCTLQPASAPTPPPTLAPTTPPPTPMPTPDYDDCFSSGPFGDKDLPHLYDDSKLFSEIPMDSWCKKPSWAKIWSYWVVADTVEECARVTKETLCARSPYGNWQNPVFDVSPTGFMFWKIVGDAYARCAPFVTKSRVTEIDWPFTAAQYRAEFVANPGGLSQNMAWIQTCQQPAPTTAPASTPAATTPPPPSPTTTPAPTLAPTPQCQSWCRNQAHAHKPWTQRCTWKQGQQCGGCVECGSIVAATAAAASQKNVFATSTTQAITASTTTIPVASVAGLSKGMSATISNGRQTSTRTITSVIKTRRLASTGQRLQKGSITINTPFEGVYEPGVAMLVGHTLSDCMGPAECDGKGQVVCKRMMMQEGKCIWRGKAADFGCAGVAECWDKPRDVCKNMQKEGKCQWRGGATEESSPVCKNWCARNRQPWEKKCKRKKCKGCAACTSR